MQANPQGANMKRLTLAASVLVALTPACSIGGEGFAAAVPQRDNVSMRVPQSQEQALVVGERATMYDESVRIAAGVNGGVLWVFDVIDAIVLQPPTTLEDDTAVWGPSEPHGLERLSFMLTVVRVEDQHFSYSLAARPRGDDGDFTEIFGGEAFPSATDDGHGTLTLHLGTLRQLGGGEACLTGDIDVAYDAGAEPRTLDVVFTQVANDCVGERPTNAHYVYSEAADASGQMDFAFRANIHRNDEDKPLEEIMSVRSRWLSSGAGRSDVQVSEGEVPADLLLHIPGTSAASVELVQCWDESFVLVHGDTNPDELEPHLGQEATGDASACAFVDASHAQL
jgi:hypothetical protein